VLCGVLVGGHATEIQSPATCPLSPRRKTVWTRVVRLKVVGTHRAGQQTAPCSEKAQASRMQLQWSRMGAHLRRAAHGMRGGDFTEKRTSGMSRPTPIAAVPPPGQLTSRGQSVGVADRHATTAGAARATRHGREGRRGGDLYGGGCPCSSTPCAGTRGRDKARGARKVEHMF
jgi:hypothetical protein